MKEKEESEHLDAFPILGLSTISLAMSTMIDFSPMAICKAMQMDANDRVRTFGFRMETALLREELKREKENAAAKRLHDEWWKWSGNPRNWNYDETATLKWMLEEAKGEKDGSD